MPCQSPASLLRLYVALNHLFTQDCPPPAACTWPQILTHFTDVSLQLPNGDSPFAIFDSRDGDDEVDAGGRVPRLQHMVSLLESGQHVGEPHCARTRPCSCGCASSPHACADPNDIGALAAIALAEPWVSIMLKLAQSFIPDVASAACDHRFPHQQCGTFPFMAAGGAMALVLEYCDAGSLADAITDRTFMHRVKSGCGHGGVW